MGPSSISGLNELPETSPKHLSGEEESLNSRGVCAWVSQVQCESSQTQNWWWELIKFPLREGSKGRAFLEYPILDHTHLKWTFQFRTGLLGKTWDQEGVFHLRKRKLILLWVSGWAAGFDNPGGLARDWDLPAKPISPSWKWEWVWPEKKSVIFITGVPRGLVGTPTWDWGKPLCFQGFAVRIPSGY